MFLPKTRADIIDNHVAYNMNFIALCDVYNKLTVIRSEILLGVTSILQTTDATLETRKKKQQPATVLLDMSKAFDSVYH